MSRTCRPIRTCLLIAFASASLSSVPVEAAQTTSDPVERAASKHPAKGTRHRGGTAATCSGKRRYRIVRTPSGRARRVLRKACAKRNGSAHPRRGASGEGPTSGSVTGTATPTAASPGSSDWPNAAGSPLPLIPPLAPEGAPAESPAGSPGSPPGEPAPPGPEPDPGSFRFFPGSSFWNETVPSAAAVDERSPELVGALGEEIAREQGAGNGPWINTTSSSVPIYTVEADQATVPVGLEYDVEPALASSWAAVPLPPAAKAAAGSDKYLVVWQPSTDRMWEFWRLTHTGGEWSAAWGGSIQRVSSDPGVFTAAAWPGSQPWWGATATSLALVGGLITFQDLQQGRIEHALAMSLPEVRSGVYVSPAHREDGRSSDPLSLPEGAHLRIDPALDLSTLHLPPLTLMIAEAAQRYGIFIRDRSSNVALLGQDPTTLPSNPYSGRKGYFEGKYPNQLLASFPWSRLQVLRMNLNEG